LHKNRDCERQSLGFGCRLEMNSVVVAVRGRVSTEQLVVCNYDLEVAMSAG